MPLINFYLIRIITAITIATIYMCYDLFNRRNIPNIIIYTTSIIGIAFLFIMPTILVESATFAIIAFSVGFLIYKIGQIGLGDIIEIVLLSLIIPFQEVPLLINKIQYSLPFILSLFIASGFIALIIVPIIYIPKAARKNLLHLNKNETKKAEFKVIIFSVAYLIFAGMLANFGMLSLYGIILIGIFIFSSDITILFEKAMLRVMIIYKKASELGIDDMIAISLMNKELLDSIKSKVPEFTGLATKNIIEELKENRINSKIPVYENGIPFAVPIFLGLIISLLFGNILLLII
ncbi:MAG: hypothetical protein QW582_02185 [Candidatus Micrarchaeaceae archaeon]